MRTGWKDGVSTRPVDANGAGQIDMIVYIRRYAINTGAVGSPGNTGCYQATARLGNPHHAPPDQKKFRSVIDIEIGCMYADK